MCGITGYFSSEGVRVDAFSRANNIIRHRGPDDFGYLVLDRSFSVTNPASEALDDLAPAKAEQSIGMLGFRRLSIIDLSYKGHQPMSYQNRKLWIVYNGEIYNYLELKEELIHKGYSFESDSDTEVILAAYAEWGVACLERFNGMWAFALLDLERRRLFCARDRLGIKPFYYFYDGRAFGFGSEVKQLLELRPDLRKANRKVFFDYLALGAYGNESDETFFDQVYKLTAGSYFTVDLREGVQLGPKVQYWNLPGQLEKPGSEAAIQEKIRCLLSDSIRLRLRSDVPVGICLSGGLDSSGISMLVGRHLNGAANSMKLFTIGSVDARIDETDYARIIAESTSYQHLIKFPDGNDLSGELSKFIWHHDEPLIKASMFGGYHVYKLARESGTTVVLDGQGADELMGGYNTGIQYAYLAELLSNGSLGRLIAELRSNAHLYHSSELKTANALVTKVLKKAIRPLLPEGFQPGLYRNTDGWLEQDYIKGNIGQSILKNKEYLSPHDLSFKSHFKQYSYELIRFTNLPGILRQVDRNSMAFSVEARVPFLDHRLVEYLFQLPVDYHLRKGYTKYAYRKSMEGIIPEGILWRIDKQGFSMPDRLLLKEAATFVADVIDGIPADSAIYDKSSIEKIYKQELQADAAYRPIFWRVINALVWQDVFNVNI